MLRKLFVIVAIVFAIQVHAQDLEPRLMSMAPTNLNFAIGSYAYSRGDIITDVALPVEDLDASIHSFVTGYLRTFKLFGRLSKFDAIASYNFGNWNADLNEEDTSTHRNGFGDPFLRFSIILIGGKALTPTEFKQTELKKFRLGLGFRVRLPLGQYDPEKLINLGMNRWAFKAAIGGSWQLKKMLFELKATSWFFTPNSDFYGGNTVKQRPVMSGQIHWSYEFKKGLWLAVSLDYYGFGALSFNDGEYKNPLGNTRLGLALAIPLAKGHALKIAYNGGTSARFGANFNTIVLAYQFMWMKKH